MSKRFGRNQKRAFRAQVAAQHETIVAKNKEIHAAANRLANEEAYSRHLRMWANEVVRMVQRACVVAATIDEQEIEHQHEQFVMPVFPEMEMIDTCFPGPQTYKTMNVVLDVLKINVVQQVLSGAMHVNLKLHGEHYGYAISKEALRVITPRILEQQLAPNIAKAIAEAILGGGYRNGVRY